jgi:hypothetical protein
MGRIQMRETNYLQIVTSGLHRTAGPYKSTWSAGALKPAVIYEANPGRIEFSERTA